MEKKAKFYGLNMIHVYLELSGGQLQDSLILLQHLESCQNKPYILDDDIVKRIIKQHMEQKEMFPIALKQCALWRTQNPTQKELDNIKKIEGFTQRLQRTTERILFIADHYKDHTIDRILEKDEGELAISFLLGQSYDPVNDRAGDKKNDEEPWGPGSPQDFEIFHNPNEKGVQNLYQINVSHIEPSDLLLAEWYKDYVKAREILDDFHDKVYEEGMEDITLIAKELGNYDPVEEIAVIQNDAEMNVFYDYLSLYRLKNGKCFLSDWLMRNSKAVTKTNKTVVKGYVEARFSVLRIDKNLSHGAILVLDIITQKSHVLIDKALNASRKQGCFFCGSIISRDYIMTTGGGILVDGRSPGGKAILTIVLSQLDILKNFNSLTSEVMRSIQKIYGFCLRNGVLSGMTTNQNY